MPGWFGALFSANLLKSAGEKVPQSARCSAGVGGCKSYLGNAQMPSLAILLGLPLDVSVEDFIYQIYLTLPSRNPPSLGESTLPPLLRSSPGVGEEEGELLLPPPTLLPGLPLPPATLRITMPDSMIGQLNTLMSCPPQPILSSPLDALQQLKSVQRTVAC